MKTCLDVTLAVIVVGVLVGVAGCRAQPPAAERQPAQPAAQAPPGQAQRYDLRGKVISVDKAARSLTVDHEAIPGFMSAMTMSYPVKDERLLDNLSPGEAVTAKLISTGSEYWLEDIAPQK